MSRTTALAACLCALLVGGVGYAALRRVNTAAHESSAHGHTARHGGIVTAVGSHHIEALLEKGGGLRIYMLGADETQLAPIEATELDAEAQPMGSVETTPIRLRAQSQSGDPPGKAAQFVGQLPAELRGQPLNIALNVPLDGLRYRIRFTLGAQPDEAEPHLAMPQMPEGRAAETERRLFLEPGGLYTERDILANGRTVPSQKYRGIRAEHNLHPKSGDRLCPITNTLANPRFSWVINGKTYQFCCPPCIEEFVARAKEKPTTIRPPQDYVQR